MLERCDELIVQGISEPETRADAYVALAVFNALLWPAELVTQVLTRRELMRESPGYRQIVEEGLQEGLQQGRQEGREEGQVERLHKDLPEDWDRSLARCGRS
ncbi:MAG: hypothetical protein AB1505_35650 [Candidatus Latescibacterota bacterium]